MALRATNGTKFHNFGSLKVVGSHFFENLILVQDERWRRALGMQIERSRGAARRSGRVVDG